MSLSVRVQMHCKWCLYAVVWRVTEVVRAAIGKTSLVPIGFSDYEASICRYRAR